MQTLGSSAVQCYLYFFLNSSSNRSFSFPFCVLYLHPTGHFVCLFVLATSFLIHPKYSPFQFQNQSFLQGSVILSIVSGSIKQDQSQVLLLSLSSFLGFSADRGRKPANGMCLFICVCVCAYIHIFVCTHVCTFICVCACMLNQVSSDLCICKSVHMN